MKAAALAITLVAIAVLMQAAPSVADDIKIQCSANETIKYNAGACDDPEAKSTLEERHTEQSRGKMKAAALAITLVAVAVVIQPATFVRAFGDDDFQIEYSANEK
ncbi:hypothetical protein MTO96_032725 [Rhipicephalus appendiculatus]